MRLDITIAPHHPEGFHAQNLEGDDLYKCSYTVTDEGKPVQSEDEIIPAYQIGGFLTSMMTLYESVECVDIIPMDATTEDDPDILTASEGRLQNGGFQVFEDEVIEKLIPGQRHQKIDPSKEEEARQIMEDNGLVSSGVIHVDDGIFICSKCSHKGELVNDKCWFCGESYAHLKDVHSITILKEHPGAGQSVSAGYYRLRPCTYSDCTGVLNYVPDSENWKCTKCLRTVPTGQMDELMSVDPDEVKAMAGDKTQLEKDTIGYHLVIAEGQRLNPDEELLDDNS